MIDDPIEQIAREATAGLREDFELYLEAKEEVRARLRDAGTDDLRALAREIADRYQPRLRRRAACRWILTIAFLLAILLAILSAVHGIATSTTSPDIVPLRALLNKGLLKSHPDLYVAKYSPAELRGVWQREPDRLAAARYRADAQRRRRPFRRLPARLA